MKIIESAKTRLYVAMRFLGLALGSLLIEQSNRFETCATDGFSFFFNNDFVEYKSMEGKIAVNRMYLHTVLHCLYRHIIMKGKRNKQLWNISCDISCEYIIDSVMNRCLQKHQSKERSSVYAFLRSRKCSFTAQSVYEILADKGLDEETLNDVSAEFYSDSHALWYDDTSPKSQIDSVMQKWGKIGERADTEAQTFARESAEDAQTLTALLGISNRTHRTYSELLHRFSVRREVLKPDIDSINTSYYMYGLSLYGNLALVEPQETREEKRVQSFVIVIDTSMSCSEETIKAFLNETYNVLVSDEFAPHANVRIIQCDDKVRSDTVLYSSKDIKAIAENFTVKGRGGTDFRPAFEYINDLIAQGQLKGLKGVFLFTDGDGIFPKKRPKYDTAFVFPNSEYPEEKIPQWGIKVVME